MKPLDPGTGSESVLYTRIPGTDAGRLPFYSSFLGEYHCDSRYHVDRASFAHYLLLYVRAGTGYAETGGRHFELHDGDILLLDCHLPHRYGTLSHWVIQWIHFDGTAAAFYFEQASMGGQLTRTPRHASVMLGLQKIIDAFAAGRQASDLLLSRWLTDLLTDLIVCRNQTEEDSAQFLPVENSIHYINEHFCEDISLDALAAQSGLSPFYFSRLFKARTGYSPHQYVIAVRLDYSRYLLRSTDLTTKEIAFRCGFHTESSFCTRFRAVFEQAPQSYRKSS